MKMNLQMWREIIWMGRFILCILTAGLAFHLYLISGKCKGEEHMKTETVYRIEAHLWFKNFDEYSKRQRELHELLGKLHGDGSVTVFFKATP